MRKYKARSLLKYSMDELWAMMFRGGNFILVFDDGEELATNWRHTLYSAYAWEFVRQNPEAPLLVDYHVTRILSGRRAHADTHLNLLEVVAWGVYDHCKEMGKILDTEDYLEKEIYRIDNLMYNDLSYRLEEYVAGMSILDFIDVYDDPEIQEVKKTLEPTEESISAASKKILDIMNNSPRLANNALCQPVRSKNVKANQALQCIGPLGYRTDMDARPFRDPIMVGYLEGAYNFMDSFMDSRTASMALGYQGGPLRQTEFFSRRSQLVSETFVNLHHDTDCGSKTYLPWRVRPGDLSRLVGKYYVDDDGTMKVVKAGDKALLGRLLNIRSVIHCKHPDRNGVCSTCFGEYALSVPRGANVGQITTTTSNRKISQLVLSTKHHIGSAHVDPIVLSQVDKKYLDATPDGMAYLLSPRISNARVELVINHKSATNINDIHKVDNVRRLDVTRVTAMSDIGIRIEAGDFAEEIWLGVEVKRRLASLTHDMLDYVKVRGWTMDEENNYTIDMEYWDWSRPILELPLRQFSMADHSKDIANFLESRKSEQEERDKNVSIESFLMSYSDISNEKIDTALVISECQVQAFRIVSAEKFDYRIPKPWDKTSGLGVMQNIMRYRSLSASMAYMEHIEILTSPMSFLITNRPDHPMDMVMCPVQVQKGRAKLYRNAWVFYPNL